MIIPRPFQTAAMASVGQKFREGAKAVCVVAPTGSGKSALAAMMAARFVAAGKRIAWGAHRSELLDQAAATLRSFGLTVGMRGRGASSQVLLGSFQQWTSRGQAPEADVFIADEAHHLSDRSTWATISSAYRQAGARLIGLTATPCRADGRALPDFDALVVAAQIKELQALGLLVPLVWRGPTSQQTSKRAAAPRPVDAYLTEARGRCAAVFAPHVRAAQAYADDFRALGVDARVVTGDMRPEDREAALQAHKAGTLPVLVSVGVLTEGWDNPRCDCVIVARGCGSAGLWIQIVGRGLRPRCTCGKLARGEACSCAKADCLLLDLHGVAHTLGRPDAEATYSLEGEGITLVKDAERGERLCKVCKTPLGDEFVCLTCGKDHTPQVPRYTGDELSDWEDAWAAAKGILKPSAMIASLAGILRKQEEARRKGKVWKAGAAEYRFQIIFKRRPYPQEMASARNMLRAAIGYEAAAVAEKGEVGT